MTYDTHREPPSYAPPPFPPPSFVDIPRTVEAVTAADVLVRSKPPQKSVSFAPVTVFAPVVAMQAGHSSNNVPSLGADGASWRQNRHPSDTPSTHRTPIRHRQSLVDPEDRPPAYHDFRRPSGTARSPSVASIFDTRPQSPPPTNGPQAPAITYIRSPTSNASEDDAKRGAAFMAANPLQGPLELNMTERHALSMGYSGIVKPKELGKSRVIWCCRPSIWAIVTKKPSADACFLSSTPLYSALHSPSHDFTMRCYFEAAILRIDTSVESGVAIGYAAQPYPTWRMPGHERGSIGVHGDDGRRYINDSWGGRDFVDPFRPGDVVGIGMRFQRSAADERVRLPTYDDSSLQRTASVASSGGVVDPREMEVRIFFARNGRLEATWDLHELVDADFAQPGGLSGLEGQHDLFAAVGVWGKVDVEIRYGRNNWMYIPTAT